MENHFLSGYSGDISGGSSFDPMFSGVSLQTILSLNPSVFSGLTSLPYLPDDFLSLIPGEVTQASSTIEDHISATKEKKPILPKSEPCPLDFFSTTTTATTNNVVCPSTFYDSSTFHLLPELHSIESFSQKRRRFDSPTVNNGLFAVAPAPAPSSGKLPGSSSVDAAPVGGKFPPVIPQSNLARQRRQKLSDKTRCLQKLMPWDTKMDQATLLEEAYKYVKFLQAQFYALQSMPSDSPSFLNIHSDNNASQQSRAALPNGDVFGDLERLNRNQVLQVLVNSPVAQTKLYSQGFCVFSLEQLSLLNNISSRRLLLQQIMSQSQIQSDHNTCSNAFFN